MVTAALKTDEGTKMVVKAVTPEVSPYKSLISGGMAGCIGKTLTAPLSRLTILYQVGPLLRTSSQSSSVVQQNSFMSLIQESRKVVSQEGVMAFWKGNLASVLHRFPYSAINFSVYESVKATFRRVGYDETPAIRLFCGAAGGGVACAAAYPLDLVRTRLSIDTGKVTSVSTGKSKIVGIIEGIVKKEGVRGLYRGLLVSMSVSVPNLAIGFSVYGTLKEKMLTHPSPFWARFRSSESRGRPSLNGPGAMISGAFGGVISSLIVFPLDVVRRRMQVLGSAHSSGSVQSNTGAGSLMAGIVRQEGMKGLYRGIIPELLKVTPMVGITFCAYEMSLALLNKVL
jgi:solute carrier family 25 phosphate transporter 23/24/25/41